MIAMTTSNSISVNPRRSWVRDSNWRHLIEKGRVFLERLRRFPAFSGNSGASLTIHLYPLVASSSVSQVAGQLAGLSREFRPRRQRRHRKGGHGEISRRSRIIRWCIRNENPHPQELVMITKVSVAAFKSLEQLEIELGQLNVFVGANGSGKSNLLEALGVLSAAADGKVTDQTLLPARRSSGCSQAL